MQRRLADDIRGTSPLEKVRELKYSVYDGNKAVDMSPLEKVRELKYILPLKKTPPKQSPLEKVRELKYA